jgi:hypothetical protein
MMRSNAIAPSEGAGGVDVEVVVRVEELHLEHP